MKLVIILILSLPSVYSFGQITSIWKGKTPGHEFDWHWADNWSNHRQPDDHTDVFIPIDNTRTFNYPIIKSGGVLINSLHMHSDAIILIRKGTLTILDQARSHYLKNQVMGLLKTDKNDLNNFPVNDLTSIRSNKF